ncbi:uncharacterized protein [Nicotiana sylvestris]|uniref:uncharacterized protein n=1 Tax=Nicotiana sylvestris TaxID=4096 RepID=UPI00388CB893
MSSPSIDEREIELDNFAAQNEVGDDEFIGDEDMNIDGAAEREEVTFDKGQAVGPTDKRVSDLTNFLGIIARNPRFIPLVHTSSHAVSKDIKQQMWEYVNFLIPTEGEKWVMTGLRDAWKRKRNIKKKYFDKNDTIEQMLQILPNEIPEVQFRQLIEYWNNEDVQAMCQLNFENRKKQKWRHRMGLINFARVRVALHATKENNEEPSKSEMFITTCTKKGKEVHTDTQVAISELQNRQSFGETADDAFRTVFGKEQPGRVDIVKDIQESMLEELDFKKEAANVESSRRYLEAMGLTKQVTTPKVYPQCSTKRVLTMERLYGVILTDLDSIKSLVSSPETSLITALNVW